MGQLPTMKMGSGIPSNERPAAIRRPQSFAEVIAVLERLNALEASVATAIVSSRVPPSEVRQFLRAESPGPASNTPAFQFMRQIFAQVGLPLTVEAMGRFVVTFGVEETSYARLFAGERPGKTCAFVSKALTRFLEADFGLSAQVEEAACTNAGDPRCLFTAALSPVSVRAAVLDPIDWAILRRLGSGDDLASAMLLTREEVEFRMERLVEYGLAAANGRRVPEGDEALIQGPPPEDFEPPWRETSRLAEAIAGANSFAEAVVVVASREPGGEPSTDPETTALAAECRSFAELLARVSRERPME